MMSVTVYDAKHKIWSGPAQNAGLDKTKSIGTHLYESMSKSSSKICQITHPEGTVLTYEQALALSIKVAQYLRNIGLNKDDVVGIVAKGSTMILPIAVGCWFSAIPFYPIYAEKDRNFIAHLFSLVSPKLIFCDVAELEELQAACDMMQLTPELITIEKECVKQIKSLWEIFELEISHTNFRPTELIEGPTQTSVYLSSSGTTGFPKCVHISNEYLLENTHFGADSALFSFSNQNWISGLFHLYWPLLSGCKRIITTLPSDPELMFEIIATYKVTHVMTITPVCAQMGKSFAAKPRDLSTVQALSFGGSIISKNIYLEALKMLPHGIVVGAYAATEWGLTASNMKYTKPNAAGQLKPGVCAKIIDDTGHCLGVGEVGEILVNNGKKWKGYVGNAKETALVLDADGWFHTGDLGYFDADADLFVVDRKKNVLKFRGVDYCPCDIEQALADLADIIEVCAFGIPDDLDVDRPAVAVTLKSGSALTKLDIEKHVASKLPYHMHLHGGVYFVENFPRTDSGKILRRAVRDKIIAELKNV